MDNLAFVPVVFTLAAAYCYPAVPEGYSLIDDEEYVWKHQGKLTMITRFFSMVLAALAGCSLGLQPNHVFAGPLLVWVLLGFWAGKLHTPQNVVIGSHMALFLLYLSSTVTTVLLHRDLLEQFDIKDNQTILCIIQTGLATIYILILGFWSDRSEQDDADNVSREKGASLFSQLTFSWLSDFIKMGNKRTLVQEDLWRLIDGDKTRFARQRFEKIRSGSFVWSILKFNSAWIAYQLTCALISCVLGYASPYYLYQVVNFLAISTPRNRHEAIYYLLALLICALTKSVIDGQIYFTGRRVGNRTRAVLNALLYEKALKRTMGTGNAEDEQASLGKIVTIMSVDTERIRTYLSYSHDIVVTFVSTIIALLSLYLILGWSFLAGVVSIIILLPVGNLFGGMISKLQEQLMNNTDNRITIMNEILQGIRILKYFAWENHFKSRVKEAREKELKSLYHLWFAYIGMNNIGQGTSIAVAFVTFCAHTLVFKQNLDAATAFTAINLLRVMADLLAFLPHNVTELLKAKVSVERVSKFLDEEELEKFQEGYQNDKSIVCGFKHASFKYYGDGQEATESTPLLERSSQNAFTMRDLHVEIPLDALTVIAGATGAGKSSILLALLGEMKRLSGDAYLPDSRFARRNDRTGLDDSVAYVAQTAWLQNATIRDNILFGEPFDQRRYEKVVRDCALVKDFETLEGGDLTEMGEKGINVSGGQKQRIALARACYSRAQFVLLDDPLSAVDAPTARYLLKNCILGSLKGRTVLLVSHAVSLVLPYADYCIVLKNGEICCQGSPAVVACNPAAEGIYGLELVKEAFDEDEEDQKPKGPTKEGTRLVEDEEKADGAVKWAIYKIYFLSLGGIIYCLLYLLTFFLNSGTKLLDDWWLKKWTDEAAQATFTLSQPTSAYLQPRFWSFVPKFTVMEEKPDVLFYIGVYALFGILMMISSNIQFIISLWGSFVAARSFHERLLDAVLFSPLRFFEVTPIGRILNRFSKDVEQIDQNLNDYVSFFINRVIATVTIIGVIGALAPTFLYVVFPVIVVFYYVANRYLTVSRELKRLESVSKSPIYSLFSETLTGISTIRAFGAQERFLNRNEILVDNNHEAFFLTWVANRWLCLRTDCISAFVVFFAGISVVLSGLEAGWAALTITYALDFTNAILWLVRMHAEMEMGMNSVERVQEYTEIPQEPAAIVEGNRPPQAWPQYGGIEVREISIRYAPELPDVLKQVSFTIKPREKVAVVGRTGAGKSTLSLAFFRIIPLSHGSIVIDGIDIANIGLYDLRSKLTIIPQDPILFSGTLRSNLDPLNERTDQEIWDSLKRVNLLDSLQTDAGQMTLDYQVSENGQNFSQGQRQLLCLARALLRQTRVVLLDEATASVDYETDARIQETIRQEFVEGTVVTIAHRLRTVIDYDKVLVLGKGQVLEYGSPRDLIAQKGVFNSMCEETGEYEELVSLANSSHFRKQ